MIWPVDNTKRGGNMPSELGIMPIDQEVYDIKYVKSEKIQGHHNRRPGTNESLEPIEPKLCLRCWKMFQPTREHEYANHCPECLGVLIVRVL